MGRAMDYIEKICKVKDVTLDKLRGSLHLPHIAIKNGIVCGASKEDLCPYQVGSILGLDDEYIKNVLKWKLLEEQKIKTQSYE